MQAEAQAEAQAVAQPVEQAAAQAVEHRPAREPSPTFDDSSSDDADERVSDDEHDTFLRISADDKEWHGVRSEGYWKIVTESHKKRLFVEGDEQGRGAASGASSRIYCKTIGTDGVAIAQWSVLFMPMQDAVTTPQLMHAHDAKLCGFMGTHGKIAAYVGQSSNKAELDEHRVLAHWQRNNSSKPRGVLAKMTHAGIFPAEDCVVVTAPAVSFKPKIESSLITRLRTYPGSDCLGLRDCPNLYGFNGVSGGSGEFCYVIGFPRRYVEEGQQYRRKYGSTDPQPKDTRITVSRREDLREYERQRTYIKYNPDCESVPPKRARDSRIGTRITVSKGEDPTEYERQRKYIKYNPDCESVPPKRARDTRITVSYPEDPPEYNRQRSYIRSHPDCESVPPKQR